MPNEESADQAGFEVGLVSPKKCAAKTRRREGRREELNSNSSLLRVFLRAFASSRRIGNWLRHIRLFGVPQNRLGVLLIVLLAIAPSFGIDAPTTQPITNFVRFDEDGHGGGKMQAALGRYVNDDGVQVDLLSTMHIGDKAFFRDLSRQFPKYDAVLYELVAPRAVPPTEEGVNDQQLKIARM